MELNEYFLLPTMYLNRGCGIYCILNTLTLEKYIGSTVDFHDRMLTHLCRMRTGKQCSLKLKKAYDQYGEGVFRFLVLKLVAQESLEDAERDFILNLRGEYNYQLRAKRHSYTEERNMKISNTLNRKIKRGRESPLFNRKRPRHEVERIFATRATKIPELYRKMSTPVTQASTDGVVMNQWYSLNSASKQCGIPRETLRQICLGKLKAKDGFHYYFFCS